MIQKMTKVIYRAFSNTRDDRGQLKQSSTDTDIDMMIRIRGQVNVEDPRFIDCSKIGITEATVAPGNYIVDDKEYLIQYVIPSGRFNQVFLKELIAQTPKSTT